MLNPLKPISRNFSSLSTGGNFLPTLEEEQLEKRTPANEQIVQ